MPIQVAETKSFRVGKYVVRQQPIFLNPSWPEFLVFLNGTLIGKCISMPDVGACEWLENEQRAQSIFAYSEEQLPELSVGRRGRPFHIRRERARPPRRVRTAKAA